MTRLEWDKMVERTVQTGLDRGVLYAPNGVVVPWNGLVSVDQSSGSEFDEPVFYDGRQTYQGQTAGNYSGSLSAFTYPEEFDAFSGFAEVSNGVSLGGQPVTETFGLSWRTYIGPGDNPTAAYKIHILYNVSATPSDITWGTLTDDSEPMTFEWDIRAIPEELHTGQVTAYVVIDSRKFDKYRMASIERYLYGSSGREPYLGTIDELMSHIQNDVLFTVTDNNDGTWTVEGPDDLIYADGDYFEIFEINNARVDETTYRIGTTEYS